MTDLTWKHEEETVEGNRFFKAHCVETGKAFMMASKAQVHAAIYQYEVLFHDVAGILSAYQLIEKN